MLEWIVGGMLVQFALTGACWRTLTYHPGPSPKKPGPGASQRARAKHEVKRQSHYNVLMKSRYWRDKRQAILDRDGRRCLGCGARQGMDVRWLEVHHYTYKRFCYEDDEDLGSYCPRCHAIEDDKRRKRIGRYREHHQI